MHVIKEVEFEQDQFLSPIFTVPKKNTTEHRMILNLKELNQHIQYYHFKMETFESAIKLIKPNVFMASVDLRYAYYSVHIHEHDQTMLKFQWKGKIFQYTCLPNGISSAPRLFTKLLKLVYSTLRQYGHKYVGYIDDSLLVGDNYTECEANVSETTMLFEHLGFIIHETKSVFIPSQRVTFLGFEIDSVRMFVTLPKCKMDMIKNECLKLLEKPICTIRTVASIIDLFISTFPAVEFGSLHYRRLERQKISALKNSCGNFDSKMVILLTI
jgi:hypothetical protein